MLRGPGHECGAQGLDDAEPHGQQPQMIHAAIVSVGHLRPPDLPQVRCSRHPRVVSRLLTAEEIRAQLDTLPDWAGDTVALRRTVEFPDFPRAISAVVGVADVAEEMDHHPDMDIRWRTITFSLATHSAGGVTQQDVELAHRISAIAASLMA